MIQIRARFFAPTVIYHSRGRTQSIWLYISAVSFILLLTLCGAAWAEERPEGRRLALIIGNSAYTQLTQLDRAFDDAVEIGKVLREKANFSITRLMDMNWKSLREGIQKFSLEIKSNDVVVVYYAGHGIQSNGSNYILPTDFPDEANKLASMALPVEELLQLIRARKPTITLLILDACRNSPLTGIKNVGLAEMKTVNLSGTRIEFAASAGQAAGDGIFAPYLAAELSRPGLDIDTVFRNVRSHVEKASGGTQTTMSASQLTINFYFIPAQLAKPGEALAVLDRVASTKPRGELGQSEALRALVQQGLSLAGTKQLEGLSFRSGTFNGAILSQTTLTGTEFDGASIRNGDFTQASLAFATLKGADLSESKLNDAALAFVEGDTTNFSLIEARDSTWFAARGTKAKFDGARLTKTSFVFADLRGASFDKADLTGAMFFASDLRGASFEGATISQTDFSGSLLDDNALNSQQKAGACRMPLPIIPDGFQFAYAIKLSVIEPIPSGRFKEGYEYSIFSETEHLFMMALNNFKPCEPRKLPNSRWLPVWQHLGKDTLQRDIRFQLAHEFLQQSGRRAEIRARIRQHMEWLYPFPEGKFRAVALTSDTSTKDEWSLDFRKDEVLVFNRKGSQPFSANYLRGSDYALSINGRSGSFECTDVPAQYGWHYSPEGYLILTSYYSVDPCKSRYSVLTTHRWVPLEKAR